MKKFTLILAALFISVMLNSQVINLSGSWKLNTTMSKLNSEFSMAPKSVVLDQKGNDLKIEKHSVFQDQEFTSNDKFTLDGKECVNPGWQDAQKKSTAVWSEDKKSLKITSKMSIGDGGEMTINEIYKIDKTNLVVESSTSSSFGEMAETAVYDKQ